jgi:hypothetical protein
MNDKPTQCCFCSHPAIGIWYLSQGCAARPDLTVQPLCEHHFHKATPIGGFELIKDLTIEGIGRHE